MKAELLKRLFRTIQEASAPNLIAIAYNILEEERRLGHSRLVTQLEKILSQRTNATSAAKLYNANLNTLPTSKRDQQPLSTLLPSELLRHHMVLPVEVERRFQRIEKEYSARERLARHGLNYRKRILLYGPPGCGKSLGAERLAWSTGLPMMKVQFDAVMSSYFGESASNLRAVFDAVCHTPTLLFLDECDFVARSRAMANDVGEAPRIVNTLLMLLEDYHAPGLLVAATNLDSSLDKAIFRRFDEVLELPLPGPKEVEKLLQMTVSAMKVDLELNWEKVISALSGESAANVVKAAQDAAKQAILANELPLQLNHLLGAVAELRKGE